MSASRWIIQAEVLQGGQVAERLELDEAKIRVGSRLTSQLRLDSPSVSNIHAVLEPQDDGTCQVIDLGSVSGTFINGERIARGIARSGDELQFGDIQVRIQIIDQAARAAAQQRAAEAAAAAASIIPEGHIQLEDGSVVKPFSLEGYYDEDGNYIPGYYDEEGAYHYGYGYHDDEGNWAVAHGYYDPDGEWVPTQAPEGERPSDTEVYTENFFQDASGDTLEIAYLWSDYVLDVQSLKKPRSIFIGGGDDNDYVLENSAFTHAKYPLIAFQEQQGYRLNFTPEMTGMIQRDGESLSLTEAVQRGVATASPDIQGAYCIPLGRGTSARLDFGENTFLIRFTQVPVLLGGSMALDRAGAFYQMVSLGLHLAFMLLVFTLPEGYGGFELHDYRAEDRFVELLMPPEQEEIEDQLGEWAEEEEAAQAHREDEGQMGDELAEEVDNELAIEGEETMEPEQLARARDTAIASEAGALAVFSQMGSPLGGDRAIGGDAFSALGNLEGTQQGAARGVGGLGLAGAGRGGGGTGEVGFGRADVGGGRGRAAQTVKAGLEEREQREPQIIPGTPAIQGSLDREIIQRVVRQHRREMQHCYEQELQRNPRLEGRIVMTWIISANGSVVSSSVSETTMNNSNVENCMAQRIRRWVFPEPDGGGIVRVNYPFNFSS